MLNDDYLPQKGIQGLLAAVESSTVVSGLTHRFYRYPARFSPEFAARTIEAFTEPGDYVADPFMGGGTSAVEALSLGRKVLGCDINALSGFVARTKTTPLTPGDVEQTRRWRDGLNTTTNLRLDSDVDPKWKQYQRNLPWWLRKTLELALASAHHLRSSQRAFARGSLVKTAQWALDCRSAIPTRQEFLARHSRDLDEMIDGMEAFRARLQELHGKDWRKVVARDRRILVRTTAGLDSDPRLPQDWGKPRLVLTSPPYLGVHILYHRWQVRSRRETSAPYWLAGEKDGHPNAYYNFADRRAKDIGLYLGAMKACYRSIAAMMDLSSTLVQLVAFARPDEQLPMFLEALGELGLEEARIHDHTAAQPLSRKVPNRKWYADAKGDLGASKEFLLVHRKRAL